MQFVPPSHLQHEDFDWDTARDVGMGALAHIFVVKLNKDGRHYAVKVISKGKLMHTNKVEGAMGEKQLLEAMREKQAPFVARLYSTFQTDESLFYCMEYFPKGTLDMLCLKGALPSRACVAEVAMMIAAGMESVHRAGWVLRDLKPENICFRADGTLGLIDFDTALRGDFEPVSHGPTRSIHEQTAEERNRTYSVSQVQAMRKKSQQFVGTAGYMAPEMLDSCSWSYCSDLWALGCCVYYMSTGQPVFLEDSQFAVFRRVVKADVDFDAVADPVCRDFCRRTLVVDPTERLGAFPGPRDPNYLASFKSHALFDSVRGRWGEPDAAVLAALPAAEDAEYLEHMSGGGEPFDEWVAGKLRARLPAAAEEKKGEGAAGMGGGGCGGGGGGAEDDEDDEMD
eukprot:Rhum_TRINITY_DN26138_c0_g1::Rhum_TRINITY_DN26138_c0_g1_i1::g.183367::m.183367/K06276/PDPK1; 3-phosphoinositide dependent protein kinase-1